MLALLYSTPEGLGLSDDSIAYIAGARSILAGNGYREAWLASNGPVTHFPPGFSSMLALIGLSGLDPVRGGRLLNVFLFGANVALLGIMGWRMTRSYAAGAALALLAAVNASLFNAHAVVMSEPLYIFFSLVAFLTFSFSFNADTPRKWMSVTGLIIALAYLTRYAGLALIATCFAALILLRDGWRSKLADLASLLTGFLPLVLVWSIRNKLAADNATNRMLVFHPLTAENIEIGIYNFSEFFIPVEEWRRTVIKVPNLIPGILLILGSVLLVWLLLQGFKRFFRPSEPQTEILSFVSGLYIFGYLASIISSMMLFDASTKFKLRILAPVYVSLLILLVLFGYWLWQKRSVLLRGIVIVSGVCILTLSAYDTALTIAKLRRGGQGYASFQWYDSKAMDFLGRLPQGTRIYTNQPGPVYLYTDRPAYVLPDLVDPVTGLARSGYEEGVQQLQADVLSGNAVLALFKFGAESEDVQSTYMQLADGLFSAHTSSGDKIYTAFP